MKKLFSTVAALILAAMLVFPFGALAASNGAVFTMNDVNNVAPGDGFDITLSVGGSYAVHGMNLSIEFDPTALVLENVVRGDYLNDIAAAGNMVILDGVAMANAGKVRLGILCPTTAVDGEGELFTMHFRLKDGVTVNQQVIMVVQELIYLPMGSTTSTNVAFTTDNSIITVAGGSVPSGGYNEGDHGVGDNVSSAPHFPTRDPNDPDADVTPAMDITPDPASYPTAAPATAEPGNTDETTAPDGSDEPAPEKTGSPDDSKNVTPKPADVPGDAPKYTPYIIGGIAALLLIIVIALIARGKKRK